MAHKITGRDAEPHHQPAVQTRINGWTSSPGHGYLLVLDPPDSLEVPGIIIVMEGLRSGRADRRVWLWEPADDAGKAP